MLVGEVIVGEVLVETKAIILAAAAAASVVVALYAVGEVRVEVKEQKEIQQ